MFKIHKLVAFSSLLFLTALIFSCSQKEKEAVKSTKKYTYVIVHGAYGGSWAFKKVDSLLTSHGHTVYRPSLTGLGERAHLASADIGLSTHVKDVVNHLLFEDLQGVILVGHSYGGMVITGVADSLSERIQRLIYLDAYIPDNGESLMDLTGSERIEWNRNHTKDGFILPPWVKADQKLPKDVPQPLKTFTESSVLKNDNARKNIPATYILTVDSGKKAEDDNFASPASRAKERKWTFYQMTADHNPQWSAPEELVRLLEVDLQGAEN